ncbi:MAG TPA: hypothetical protein VLA88_03800 [Candidatus Saccharimonadales bacterium]|nr:hypothetical protein [Candidatus Saccharimonadales bacterium]
MGFAGAMRFAGSVLGIGRAPYVVDRWSAKFRDDRRSVQTAFWLLVLMTCVWSTYPVWHPAFDGWKLAWPIGITLLATGVIWDSALRHQTVIKYARNFCWRYVTATQSTPAGREDFARYANPLWWRWWCVRWAFSGGVSGVLDAIIILRVTDAIPWWCRRDRRQLVAVLEDRTEQYWAAYSDFDFRFSVLLMRLTMKVQVWEYFIAVFLLREGFRARGTLGAWMVSLGITITILLMVAYGVAADRASKRRRELAPQGN